MTRSSASSRTASRRTSLAALSLAAALAAAAGPVLAAQSVQLQVAPDGAGARIALLFDWPRADELAASLRDGLESRLTFTLRLYLRRHGLAALFGDQLLAERTVSRVAFYDFLERRFVVEEDGSRRAYPAYPEFLPAFFEVRDLPLAPRPLLAPAAGEVYVAARAQFDPVRLTPPLTIVALAGAAATHSTAWVYRDVLRAARPLP